MSPTYIMKKVKFTQSRNWCFTDFELLDLAPIYKEYSDIIRYVCYGEEKCPKTGKKHHQGWIQFINKKRLGGVKKIFGSKKIHVESCIASPACNDKYCKKDGKFISFGDFVCQGQRSDLEAIYKQIVTGAKAKDIIDNDFSTYCRYRNGIKDAIEVYTKENTRKFRALSVTYIHGETGTGKTRMAVAECANDYFKIEGSSLNWFDGYNGEKNLIIDEYANDIKVTKLLGLLDGYQLRLPVKGGFTYANWTTVYVTSNLSPEELHYNAKDKHRDALFRRITKIINKT